MELTYEIESLSLEISSEVRFCQCSLVDPTDMLEVVVPVFSRDFE